MKRLSLKLLITTLLFWISITSVHAQLQQWLSRHDYAVDKTLRYHDHIYENTIRTVQLHPMGVRAGSISDSPMIPLGQSSRFLLEFDELVQDAEQYKVKFIHCNFDWTPSRYQPIEYLYEYNEFLIMDFEYSLNTKVDFVHYTYRLPKIKLSGNYLLVVYREDEKDILITRRLVVYEGAATVGARVNEAMGTEEGLRSHAVVFNVNYGGLTLDRPEQTVFIALRQNYRWDNAITNLKPLFVKDFEFMLDYNYFNRKNEFKAGNEFRVIDFRNFSTFNVKTVNQFASMDQVVAITDKPRTGRVYNRMDNRDLNGRYIIGGNTHPDAQVEGDYVEVIFTLDAPDKYKKGEVYIMGSFNDWNLNLENQMIYDEASNTYKASLFLKQGRYDYYYVIYNQETGHFDYQLIENSHSNTSNEYDVIAYYRPIGALGDRVIGYKAFKN